MTFKWNTNPDVFNLGFAEYADVVMEQLWDLVQEFAPLVEQFMRQNAPWVDDCMPGREYLRADAFRDRYEVGIVAYYDLETYRRNCPEPEWDWGLAHETFTFRKAGVIAIILPRGNLSVLGDMADDLWDQVRAMFGSKAAVSVTSTGTPF